MKNIFTYAALVGLCGCTPSAPDITQRVQALTQQMTYTVTRPPMPLGDPRESFAAAYDPIRQRTVLYGGSNQGGLLDSTLEWDGTQLTSITTTGAIPAMVGARATYDERCGSVILFGGQTSYQTFPSTFSDELWSYDGSAWTERVVVGSRPSARAYSAFVYDAARQRSVLVGGSGSSNIDKEEVWEFDCLTLTWTDLTAIARPFLSLPSRSFDPQFNSFYYDSDVGQVFLRDDRGDMSYRVGSQWTSTTLNFNSSTTFAMTYDTRRHRALAFGQATNFSSLFLYEWSGLASGDLTWYPVANLAPSVFGYYGVSMVFDTVRGRAILFGDSYVPPNYNSRGLTIVEFATRGNACSNDNECNTGHCVDGTCCLTATCDTCQRCDSPASPGQCVDVVNADDADSCTGALTCSLAGDCLKKVGQTCSVAGDCARGFCVDGYCCDRACTGGCAACDGGDRGWPAFNGYCAAAPVHAFVAGCALECTGTESCSACATDTDCGPSDFCASDGNCTSRKALGAACAPSDCQAANCRVCSSGFCEDGLCCASACGACGQCALAGQEGSCVAQAIGVGVRACTNSSECCASERCRDGLCTAGSAPGFTSTGSSVATIHQPYSYDADNTVNVTGSAPLRFSLLSSQPATIDPVSGRIYFVPVQSGNMTLIVRAQNPWGSASQTVQIVVSSDGRPRIVRDANNTALIGQPYALNESGALSATGGTPVVFSKIDGPSNFFVAPSGRVSFRPTASGSIDVSVGAHNAFGSDVYVFRIDVAPSSSAAAPIASLVADRTEGSGNTTITFDASASTAAQGASIVSRLLVFGDGSEPSTAERAMHEYSPGAYVARLTVVDNFGQSATTSLGIRIGDGQGALPPLARIVADRVAGPTPLTVRLSCECSLAADARLRWTFGDGERSSEREPVHTYARAGGYPITLEAFVDEGDAFAQDHLDIRVSDAGKEPPELVAYASPTIGDAPLTVQLNALVRDFDSAHTTLTWKRDGAVIGSGDAVSHNIESPGRYEFVAEATDDDGLTTSQLLAVEVTRAGAVAPAILSVPALSATVGVPYRYSDDGRVIARGARPLVWSKGKRLSDGITNAPAGLEVDPSTGVVTWTPRADQVGSIPITLTATNDVRSASQDFVVIVAPTANAGCGCDVGARTGTERKGSIALFVAFAMCLLARTRRRHLFLALLACTLLASACTDDGPPLNVSEQSFAIPLTNYGFIEQVWPSGATTPPDLERPRVGSGYTAMTYDAARARRVLITHRYAAGTYVENATWEWIADHWQYITPAPAHLERQCEMTYDPTLGQVVAISPSYAVGQPSYLYTYDGASWTQIMTPTPLPLGGGCIAPLPTTGSIIYFGGRGNDGLPSGDTWTFFGGNWTVSSPPGPTPRLSPAMTFHAGEGLIYMGLGSSSSQRLNDVWTYDGAVWQATSFTNPSKQYSPVFVYDAVRNRLQLIGDTALGDGAWIPDTMRLKVHELGPFGWTLAAVGGAARRSFGAAYDLSDERTHIFGGYAAYSVSLSLFEDEQVFYTVGNSCAVDGDCQSGHCVDSVCCIQSACETCESCAISGFEGRCRLVQDLVSDPDTCPAPRSCNGTTGTCRGPGVLGTPCTSGDECSLGFCADGMCCNNACDGPCGACNPISRGWYNSPNAQFIAQNFGIIDGVCAGAPEERIEDPACGGALCRMAIEVPSCGGACLSDDDCASTHYCAANSQCAPTKAQGAFCAGDSECLEPGCRLCATAHCTDGVCCDAACGSTCQACNVANSIGSCVNVPAGGYDRRGMCAYEPTASCGTDGTCDGAGGCRERTIGTVCASGSCTGPSSAISPAVCDGAGTCGTSSPTSCGNYVCSQGACKTSCTTSLDCVDGSSCVAGSCQSACVSACASHGECCTGQRCVTGQCLSGGVPIITSTFNTTAALYAPYSYNAATSNRVIAQGTGPFAFSILSPSLGATIDPVTGALYYVPTTGGEHTLVVLVENAWGQATQQISFLVAEAEAPVIQRNANTSALVGRQYVVNAFTALTAAGARPLVFSLVEGPSEARVQQNGRIDWVPRAAGQVRFRVRADNSFGTDSYAFLVDVSSAAAQSSPVARIGSTARIGPAPHDVVFTDQSTTAPPGVIRARQWIFGDGTPPSYEPAISHRYQTFGAYIARLLVLDNLGQTGTASVGVQVTQDGVVPPLAIISADVTEGPRPLIVRFGCDCDRAATASLRWDFGDGETSVEVAPVHTYARAGSYTVTLEALDNTSGGFGLDHLAIQVRDGDKLPPRVQIFADTAAADVPFSTTLRSIADDLDGQILRYEWFIDGVAASQEQTLTAQFSVAGLHRIALHVTDNDGLIGIGVVEIRATQGGALAPTFLSTPTKTARVGVPYRYADDTTPLVRGDRPITFALGKLVSGALAGRPDGAEVDPSTGVITWTPRAGQEGPQPITLVATNAGGTTSQDWVVTVDPAVRAPGCSLAPSPLASPLNLLPLLLGILIRRKTDEAGHAARGRTRRNARRRSS